MAGATQSLRLSGSGSSRNRDWAEPGGGQWDGAISSETTASKPSSVLEVGAALLTPQVLGDFSTGRTAFVEQTGREISDAG